MHVRAARSVAPARAASSAADRSRRLPLPYAAWRDAGTHEAQFALLQQLVGNRALARLVATSAANGHAASVRLHGETTGTYDGGASRVVGRRIRRATGCDCPDDNPCQRATGALEIDYHVDVDIQMPGVPDGLSRCQRRRVRTFLDTVLAPHEREHARRMRTYNGTTRRNFDVTGCGAEDLRTALQEHLQEMHDTEASARQQAAQSLSDAIDPFEREVDLDCA